MARGNESQRHCCYCSFKVVSTTEWYCYCYYLLFIIIYYLLMYSMYPIQQWNMWLAVTAVTATIHTCAVAASIRRVAAFGYSDSRRHTCTRINRHRFPSVSGLIRGWQRFFLLTIKQTNNQSIQHSQKWLKTVLFTS